MQRGDNDVAIIGAGVAGLTAGALLARAGARVTIYERHNVPGGCASFYQRNGYRFDVGATVVNGFGPRGIHARIFRHLGDDVEAQHLDPAMLVHLPEAIISRYGDERWRSERRRIFGDEAEPFWLAQERIAERVWDFAARLPCLPADVRSALHLARIIRPRDACIAVLQGRTLASMIPREATPALRHFIDLQLLITAQAAASEADAAFGCAALDIAREGTYHLPGGIADIAVALARAVRRYGGRIVYNCSVTAIRTSARRFRALELSDGRTIAARHAIAAIPYENLLQLLGISVPPALRTRQRWGAVTAHIGIKPGIIADDTVLHHQLLTDGGAALGEGNSAFVSISAPGDNARARNGGRAVTVSTHTDVARWETARDNGTLDVLRREYSVKLHAALERAAGKSIEPDVFELGTPFTFERYTGRYRGMVGGTPQMPATASLRARSHRTKIEGLLLCGDTAFPGQSTAGVSLSAINAVRALGVPVLPDVSAAQSSEGRSDDT